MFQVFVPSEHGNLMKPVHLRSASSKAGAELGRFEIQNIMDNCSKSKQFITKNEFQKIMTRPSLSGGCRIAPIELPEDEPHISVPKLFNEGDTDINALKTR